MTFSLLMLQRNCCRVWKVPEESQLVFRFHGMALDCCKYITGEAQ